MEPSYLKIDGAETNQSRKVPAEVKRAKIVNGNKKQRSQNNSGTEIERQRLLIEAE